MNESMNELVMPKLIDPREIVSRIESTKDSEGGRALAVKILDLVASAPEDERDCSVMAIAAAMIAEAIKEELLPMVPMMMRELVPTCMGIARELRNQE